ncbi:MAG: hypothetical protein ACE5IM_09710, partial [Nitrospinota bacterium]
MYACARRWRAALATPSIFRPKAMLSMTLSQGKRLKLCQTMVEFSPRVARRPLSGSTMSMLPDEVGVRPAMFWSR